MLRYQAEHRHGPIKVRAGLKRKIASRENSKRASLLWAVGISVLAGCHDANESGIAAVVVGNSMAPAYWGDHVQVNCDECTFSFRVGGKRSELPEYLVCPNCGYRSINSSNAQPQPAQLVRVDPISKALFIEAQRWDVVAFRPNKEGPAMIKRVVGLPGELIEIVDGEIFVDGALARKPRYIAWQMKVPVFDSLACSEELMRRFQPEHAATGWESVDDGWQFAPSPNENETQWLAYQQWRCVANKLPRDQPVPIEDWYAGNVGVNRDLNTTSDIWAMIECQIEDDSRLDLKLNRGTESHVFELDFATRNVLLEGQNYPMVDSWFSSSIVGTGSSVVIELRTFDQRLTLVIDGSEVVSLDLPANELSEELVAPVMIGGVNSKLHIERFRLWRDIHYFDVVSDREPEGPVALRAGSNEYILLGDNVPVSIDSRHWPSPAVSADQILGIVSFQH